MPARTPSGTRDAPWLLIPRQWRWAAATVWTAATGALAALAVMTAGRSGSEIDAAIDGHLQQHLGGQSALRVATLLGSPPVILLGSIVLATTCATVRWKRGVVFALVAPALSGATAEWVLKPLVGRTKDFVLSFPSGTSASAFGIAVAACVLLMTPRPMRNPTLRLALALVALAGATVVAVAVVALGWHYASDAVGGAATAVTVAIGVAGVIDLFAAEHVA